MWALCSPTDRRGLARPTRSAVWNVSWLIHCSMGLYEGSGDFISAYSSLLEILHMVSSAITIMVEGCAVSRTDYSPARSIQLSFVISNPRRLLWQHPAGWSKRAPRHKSLRAPLSHRTSHLIPPNSHHREERRVLAHPRHLPHQNRESSTRCTGRRLLVPSRPRRLRSRP